MVSLVMKAQVPCVFLSGKRGGDRNRIGRGEKRSKKSWDEGEIGKIVERKENWMNLDEEILLWSI